MKHRLQLILLLVLAASGVGFSPYELHLRSGKENHVGLIAGVKDAGGLASAVKSLGVKETGTALAKAGITNVQAFTRKIEGMDYAVIYFAYRGGMDYIGAAEAFEKATAASGWEKLVAPHSRAVSYGRIWLQMEWICFIRGLDVEREPASSVMVGTTLRPEKEMEYRALHQAVWPGVVDQIARGNGRNLCIFLAEVDGLLLKFLYVEYVGDAEEKDAAANLADPINQRWWKLTDACQKPFSDVKDGIWAPLDPVK